MASDIVSSTTVRGDVHYYRIVEEKKVRVSQSVALAPYKSAETRTAEFEDASTRRKSSVTARTTSPNQRGLSASVAPRVKEVEQVDVGGMVACEQKEKRGDLSCFVGGASKGECERYCDSLLTRAWSSHPVPYDLRGERVSETAPFVTNVPDGYLFVTHTHTHAHTHVETERERSRFCFTERVEKTRFYVACHL
jgi:hypothetical protein